MSNYGYRWACWGMIFAALLLLTTLHRLDWLVVLIPLSLLLAWGFGCSRRRANAPEGTGQEQEI